MLSGIDQLVDREVLPLFIYHIGLVWYIGGLLGSIVLGWYHGEKGAQKATRNEIALMTGLAIAAVVLSGSILRAEFGEGPATGLEALSTTEDPRRIAVLYFEDRSPGGELSFLADGLTESLIDELSQVEVLHVVSRNGSRLFRDSSAPYDSIGGALEVGTLVEGTVAQSEDRLRVDVDMIQASTGRQIGSRRLDRPRSELFELQDELAREVAFFLREELGEEIGLIERQAGTDNVEAWELLQRAEAVARDADPLVSAEDFAAASRQLLQADSILAEAEKLAEDWVDPIQRRGWLAYRQSRLGGFDRSHYPQWIDTGMGHAQRALALAPTDPDALELRGTLQYWRYALNLAGGSDEAARLFRSAETDLRTSVEANPGQASAWTSLSHLLMRRNAVAEGKLAALRSYEADPYLANANLTLWRLFLASLDLEDRVEAENWCSEGQRRFPEDFRFTECPLWTFIMRGQEPDIELAWSLLDRYRQQVPPSAREILSKRAEMLVAMALVRANLPDSARAVAERARADATLDPIRELALMESWVQTWLGDYDEAFRLLGMYLAANPAERESIATDQTWYLQDLRQDPRFNSLVGSGS